MKLLTSYIQRFCFLKLHRSGFRCLSIAVHPKINNSYFFKNGIVPLSCATVGEVLDKAANEHGDHTSYIFHHQGISKTFLELRNEVEKLASGLIACGFRKGDRLAIYSPNCYEWPLAQLAAAKAGLILVTINFASQPLEVEHCLKKAGCKAIIIYDKLKHLDYYSAINTIIPNLKTCNPMKLQSKNLPNLEKVIMLSENNKEGVIRFKDVMDMGNRESGAILSEIENTLQCDEPVNIQFTSGTTGLPKAAVLTHHGAINGAINASILTGYDKNPPVLCCQVPLFHSFGSIFAIFIAIGRKSTIVFPCSTFDVAESLKAIEKHKCTTVIGTPTMLIDLLKTHKILKTDTSSLNQVIMGGAPIPEGVLKGLYYDLNVRNIQCGYGLTETNAAVAIAPCNQDYDSILKGFMEPLSGVEVKIVDNRSQIVPKHVQGEVCVRGYNLFSGYWEDKEKTAEAMDPKGWFHTGDIGEMNESGWIRIVGRIKDIVIRGGENIYVTEVESFLSDHTAILEVYVCGVPDERLGEELCCWISIKPGMTLTEEGVRNFCQGKLSYYKIPRYIMFVKEFPKTTTGKVKKNEMTRLSIEKLNL